MGRKASGLVTQEAAEGRIKDLRTACSPTLRYSGASPPEDMMTEEGWGEPATERRFIP